MGGVSRSIVRDFFESNRTQRGCAVRASLRVAGRIHHRCAVAAAAPGRKHRRSSLGADCSWRAITENPGRSSLRRVRTVRPARTFAINSPTTCSPAPVNRTLRVTCVGIGSPLNSTLSGFLQPELKSQESFFIRHAAKSVETIIAAEAAEFSRRKASLMQLLHPESSRPEIPGPPCIARLKRQI